MKPNRLRSLGLVLLLLGCLCPLAHAMDGSSVDDPDIEIGDREWADDSP